jgi:hypothetical protein
VAVALFLALAAHARATVVTDARWQGSDLLVRFSDSVTYKIDLAESDTAQLVIHVIGALSGPDLGSINGPNGSQASITLSGANDLRLTVHGAGKMGYASVWRPYSHTLVVHTFDWDNLEYPQEQYYKGLLALEQGLDTQAEELLQVAHSTGDRRAASVLGVHYARMGSYAQAAALLAKPADADDYAALAAVQAHNGDTAAARASQGEFERLLASKSSTATSGNGATAVKPAPRQGSGAVDQAEAGEGNDNGLETNEMIRERASRKWIYLGGGVLVLLILIGLVVWLSRRSAQRPIPPYPNDPANIPTPRPTRREPPVAPDLQVHPHTEPATEPAAHPVEATVVESKPHVAEKPAAPVEVKAEPVAVEPVVVEQVAVEQVVVEQVKAEPVTSTVTTEPVKDVVVEPARPADTGVAESADATDGMAETSGDEGTRSARSTQKQAADLRRRIEAMRSTTPTAAPPRRESAGASESTIAEARRLRLSRDSVELRRRMEASRR